MSNETATMILPPGNMPTGFDGVEQHAETPAQAAAERKPYQMFDMPEIGIAFKRFHSENFVKLISAWHNDNNSHVYKLAVRRDGDAWIATCTNDGREVFRLATKLNLKLAERCALCALQQYLIIGHRKTWRKARRVLQSAAPSADKPPANH